MKKRRKKRTPPIPNAADVAQHITTTYTDAVTHQVQLVPEDALRRAVERGRTIGRLEGLIGILRAEVERLRGKP